MPAAPSIPLDHQLQTPRLSLRRFLASDAERVSEIGSNWNVARAAAVRSASKAS
jgi:hypothetical protein